MSSKPDTEACPCGSGQPYAGCCGRWHAGPLHLQAPTPQALMRSRYSAYVRGLHDYLLATWHPSTRPAVLEPPPPGLRWLGLELRAERLLDADHGTVEFVARSKLAGRADRLHERSLFERVDGRWLYVRALDQAAAS
jgi:SEC-C motif domain protein